MSMKRGLTIVALAVVTMCAPATWNMHAGDAKGPKGKAGKSTVLSVQGTFKVNKERKTVAVTTKKGIITFEVADFNGLEPLDGKTVTVIYEEVNGKKVLKEVKDPNSNGKANEGKAEKEGFRIKVPIPPAEAGGKDAPNQNGDKEVDVDAAIDKVL